MITRILTDERYLGDGKFQAIIAKETFQKAQMRFDDDRVKALSVRTLGCTDDKKYPFSGFLKCGTCGSSVNRITVNKNRSEHLRKCGWRCYKSVFHGDEKCPKYFNIYDEMLENACREIYNKILKNPQRVVQNSIITNIEKPKPVETLIKEATRQLREAIEVNATVDEIVQREAVVNTLINQQVSSNWDTAKPNLTPYITQDILDYLKVNNEPMDIFSEEKIKAVFDKIILLEPGKLGFILKNGKQLIQQYNPLRGQVKKWQDV